MPNWCDTNYTIYCNPKTRKIITDAINKKRRKDAEHNRLIDAELEKLNKRNLSEDEKWNIIRERNLFHKDDIWLYWLLVELGYTEDYLNTVHDNIRGHITYFDEEEMDDGLMLQCDTAWGEADGFRRLLIDKFSEDDPDLRIYYTAVEPGCEVYVTNDPEMADMYYLDIENDELTDETEDCVIKIVNDRLNLECKTIDEILEAVEKHNARTENHDHIWVYKYNYSND